MNFLAHLLLAGPEPANQIGGLLGDFVKGPLPGSLPPDLALGVALHRQIDLQTDGHPLFRQSCARITPARRRVAGIVITSYSIHYTKLYEGLRRQPGRRTLTRAGSPKWPRITSYNVCYTKLLRLCLSCAARNCGFLTFPSLGLKTSSCGPPPWGS